MKERILKIVEQVLNTKVDENTSQKNCTEWDSLRHLNLIIELEMEFDISFEPEEIAKLTNVQIIESHIKEKLS